MHSRSKRLVHSCISTRYGNSSVIIAEYVINEKGSRTELQVNGMFTSPCSRAVALDVRLGASRLPQAAFGVLVFTEGDPLRTDKLLHLGAGHLVDVRVRGLSEQPLQKTKHGSLLHFGEVSSEHEDTLIIA